VAKRDFVRRIRNTPVKEKIIILSSVLLLIMLPVMLMVSNNSYKQNTKSQAVELTVESLNTELLQNNAAGRTALNQSILEQRNKLMTDLAINNPAEFLNQVMSVDARNALPEGQKGLIEERVNITGELIPIVSDNFGTNETKTKYILKTDNLYFDASLVGNPSEDSLGSKASIDGYKLGNNLIAINQDITVMEAAPAFTVVREKRIAIWPLNFTDDRSEPWSKAELRKIVFCDPDCDRSVKTYYSDVSGGRFTITGKVLDWWKSDMRKSQMCVFGPPSDSMLNKAKAKNPSIFEDYDGIVFVFNNTNCGTPYGQSTIGGNPSIAIVGQINLHGFIHELGHSFGLAHATVMNCRGECWDKSDVMGMQMANMNPLHKLSLNFIPKSLIRDFTSNGTYRVNKTGGDSPQIIKIDVPSNDWDIYIDYRNPDLKYNGKVPYPLGAGVLIYRWDGNVGKPMSYTKLIDITSGDGNENNLVLRDDKSAGWIFVTIKQLRHTNSYADIKITKN